MGESEVHLQHFNLITLVPAMFQTLNRPAGGLIPVPTMLSWLLGVQSSSIPTSLGSSHTVTHHTSLTLILLTWRIW